MRFALTAASLLAAVTVPFARASDLEARGVSDACAAQPLGSGPVAYPDTALGFVHYGTFATYSTAAAAPSGYQRTFHNQLAATTGNGYQGYYTLTYYDTATCASLCTQTAACKGFNVYYERDPLYNPCPSNPNPGSTTNIKCTLWALPPTSANATNSGETRSSFQVVIAGSNGYAKIGSLPASTPDYGVNPYT